MAHAFSPGYSGMVCDQLVLDAEGHGTDCGKHARDPIHRPSDVNPVDGQVAMLAWFLGVTLERAQELVDLAMTGGIPIDSVEDDIDEPPEFVSLNLLPCPICGETGACSYDSEGRPMLHAIDDGEDD